MDREKRNAIPPTPTLRRPTPSAAKGGHKDVPCVSLTLERIVVRHRGHRTRRPRTSVATAARKKPETHWCRQNRTSSTSRRIRVASSHDEEQDRFPLPPKDCQD